ncbi:MAG: type I-C CRISPR-associated protein Cas8c/Csd1 [Eubacteriales bacterium]|nr:type I-C CRISPR-associated protein Cas8c/Csd1 [Eubacteriales bacterium]
MILQALVSYYETLAARGELPQLGWAPVKVSYVLNLDDQGDITTVVCIKEEVTRGKKKALVPQIIQLPAPVKRTVGVTANFLCDNSSYILGADKKGKPKRSLECFQACKTLHETLLVSVEEPAARALLSFFDHWQPEKLTEHPAFAHQDMEDLLASANLIFRYRGRYLHEIPAIRQAWQNYYNNSQDSQQFPCLVTGKLAPVAQLHPSIKGIYGAQSSGASLVSFNAPAFCSYDREQGLNAPTSQYAAFAYGAALNYLIATQNTRVGDVTLLFWAESGEEAYTDALKRFGFGGGDEDDQYKEEDLKGLMESLAEGADVEWDGTRIDPNMTFYILGISPNAARLSVRFFLRNSFGQFIRNVKAHYDRLEIVRPSFDPFDNIPVWRMLKETVNPNSREKKPAADMAGDTLRTILTNTPYPATLLNGVTLRIRADREMNRTRAAILKAYYLKNRNPFVPEEVLTVSLNPDSNNEAYILGRMFSVLEAIQSDANPGINATIRDKYFSSASATPGVVFPTLVNLAQKHLRKLDEGKKIFYDKQLTELMSKLGETYPNRMNLPQQGAFQLGYYHQTQYRFTKKEDK